uniref:Uncharacterized protein n=1 Tax=Acrobeloides nanus TaxID=290746 RepID=A0A914C2I1_9BILA
MDNLTFFFDRSHDDELQLFDNFLKEINDGTKHVSVNFTKDGHLLVKSQAYFIAKAIEAVFKADIDDEFP